MNTEINMHLIIGCVSDPIKNEFIFQVADLDIGSIALSTSVAREMGLNVTGLSRGSYYLVIRDSKVIGIADEVQHHEWQKSLADAPKPEPLILMGKDNPDGMKLEDLLSKLQLEVGNKCALIENDPRLEAKTVVNNNHQIIGLLAQAEAIQKQSYAILDNMAPNEGPLGTPRIGEGSKQ